MEALAMATKRKPRIALLAAPETTPSVLFGLYDVLTAVGAVYDDMTKGEPSEARLEVITVAAKKEPFRCVGNILVEPLAALTDVRRKFAKVLVAH
jgi:hypothetical protein